MLTVKDYTNLGESGLKVSKIIVGTMLIGSTKQFPRAVEDEQKVFDILLHCYKSGLRTFDTADVYSNGLSEILLGKFLKKYNIPRETVVILTKCFFPLDESDPGFAGFIESSISDEKKVDLVNNRGLSRKHILDATANSVRRLGTYIDVQQIHRLDKSTPKKEIMKALNDIVESGQVRYIGASSMLATEFAELQFIAELNGWHKFISMQNSYNILYREEEREMIPFCANNSLGKVTCIPWSPLASGVVAKTAEENEEKKNYGGPLALVGLPTLTEADKGILKRVEEIAKKRGVSMAVIGLAWHVAKGTVPISGINSLDKVDDAVKACQLGLTDDEIKYLDELYEAKASTVFIID